MVWTLLKMGSASLVVQMILLPCVVALPSMDAVSLSLPSAPKMSSGYRSFRALNSERITLRGGHSMQNKTEEVVKWTPSPAAELHDNINIFALTGLGGASIWALCAGHPNVFNWVTGIGFVYIALDSMWLAAQPSIVKSPTLILAHHVATLLVLLDPLLQPSHSVYTAACLLVEINTVLLLLRRKFSYSNVVEVPFLITWVLLRNIWYPLLLIYFLLCALPNVFQPIFPAFLSDIRRHIEGPKPSNMLLVSMTSWAIVCLFQFVWTQQLFASHRWFGGRKKAGAAESKDKKYL